MAVQIPFPVPSHGYALNSKLRVNLDYIVSKFNEFNTGTATWDNVSIGIANNETGTLTFYNASTANYLTFQAGATSSSTTFTLPTAAPASTGILTSTSSGTMSFVSGTGILYNGSLFTGSASVNNALAKVSTSGVVTLADHSYSITSASNGFLHITGGASVTTLANSLGTEGILTASTSGTGKVKSLLGTTNQVTVTFNTNDVTLSLPQSIATSSNVQFSTLKVDAGTYASPGLFFASSTSNTVGLFAASDGSAFNVRAGSSGGSTVFSVDSTGFATSTSELRAPTVRGTTALKISTSTGSIVTIQGLTSSFGDYTLTLPPNYGNARDVLQTDGSGVLTWVSISSAGGATKALDNLAAVAINTALLPGTTNTIALGSSSKTWSNIFATAGTFSGPVGIADGSTGSATAGIYFTSDSDCGIYHEANNSVSFMTAGAKAVRINGGGQILTNDGSETVPTFSFFTDGGSGMYLPVTDVLGFTAGTHKVATMAQSTTSDDTDRTNLTLFDGGGSCYTKTKHYTTTSLSTSAKTIHVLDEFACFLIVSGNDATNFFVDIITTGFGASSVHVISSGTVQGSPTARTYTISGSSNVQLAMASGTYSINTFSLQLKAR